MKKHYNCAKCSSWEFETDEIRTTGSGFSKLFNIQNRRFTVVSCKRCGYSEFYRKGSSSGASNVLDFLTN